jgi:hypothetical protein
MMRRKILILVAMFTLSATGKGAAQASYTFKVDYQNGSVFPATDSDPMIGTTLMPGDQFTWTLNNLGSGFWQRTATTLGYFELAAFRVSEIASRVGDLTLTLLLDGVEVFTHYAPSTINSFVHVGANAFIFADGYRWDEVRLHYVLHSSTNPSDGSTVGSTFTSYSGISNIVPEQIRDVIFVADDLPTSTVPEPATLVLLGSGLLRVAGMKGRVNPPVALDRL